MLTIGVTGEIVELLSAKELELYRTGTDEDRARLDKLVQKRKARHKEPCALQGLLCQRGCDDWGCTSR